MSEPILMGVVGRAYGVRGLCHVHSYTADPSDLARYSPLQDGKGGLWTLTWVRDGVARLADQSGRVIADRGAAEKLVNLRLYADRAALPPADDDEFYLADLIGLQAVDADDGSVGRVANVFDHGAGAYLEIMREGQGTLLLPFTKACVPVIDLAARRMRIDIPAEIVASDKVTKAEEAA